MSHTAELIAVGTELLLGNIANTDAQMISQGLSQLGINVFYHTVVGDNPERVRQAASLLLDNAMKYASEGGTIRVSLTGGKKKTAKTLLAEPKQKADDGKKNAHRAKKEYGKTEYSTCTLCVYNTADNLTPGSQDILFERFYRADKSRNSKTGGHGIGLSVVRAIAEAHGGTASANSKDGNSIEFIIKLN